MLKVGLSTCNKKVDENLFASYSDAGIEAMEISLVPEEYDVTDYKQMERLADHYGVELWSFHLPFTPFERIDPSNRNLQKHTLEYFAGLIEKGADIGIDKFVVHSSGEPIDPAERAGKMACAKESLAELAEIAAKYNAVIAVEDLPRTCLGCNSSEIGELVGAHSALKVCFDTNHLLGENPVDFIRNMGNKIITTHVSDYDFINERHWLPGEGKLDWNGILSALAEINYQGAWVYELGFKCPKTILRDRDLTCADFARNASELFANKEITILSKPKPNIGKWDL